MGLGVRLGIRSCSATIFRYKLMSSLLFGQQEYQFFVFSESQDLAGPGRRLVSLSISIYGITRPDPQPYSDFIHY